eukprot:s824_g13.t1
MLGKHINQVFFHILLQVLATYSPAGAGTGPHLLLDFRLPRRGGCSGGARILQQRVQHALCTLRRGTSAAQEASFTRKERQREATAGRTNGLGMSRMSE